jgi:uncharacterized membrane protein
MLLSSYLVSIILGLQSKKALEITILLNVINTIIYYLHEKIWNNQ